MPDLKPIEEIAELIADWKKSAWKTESNTVPNPGEALERRILAASSNKTGQAWYDIMSIASICVSMDDRFE